MSLLAPEPVIYLVEPYGGSIRRQNPNTPHVFWDDAAVTRGDGVFETILIRNGKPRNVERHLERFARSAEALELPVPDKEHWLKATEEAVADYVRERGGNPKEVKEAKCTWTLSRGRETTGVATAWLTVRDIDPEVRKQRDNGVKVVTTPRGFVADPEVPWMVGEAKTLNYAANMAALRWAREQGADDVMYVERETGRVLEGATSTVIMLKKGGRMRTPAPGPGVMAGTTQAALFALAEKEGFKCKAKDIYINELLKAESVWLVSSTRICARVTHIDGTKLATPENEAEIKALISAAAR